MKTEEPPIEPREIVWGVFAQFWVDTSYDDAQLDQFAEELVASGLSLEAIECIVFEDVCGAFAQDTVAMFLSAGMSLRDWFFPEEEARQQVREYLARPKWRVYCDPIWHWGRFLARRFVRDDWRELRSRIGARQTRSNG